jgi:hypothetical protein
MTELNNISLLKIAQEILSEVDNICLVIESNFSNYSKGSKKICALLFKQIHGLVTAILLLCEKGLFNEARILTRSLVEVTAYLLYISDTDSEERVNLYRHSQALSEKIAVDEFNLSLTKNEVKVKIEFYEKIEQEALRYFRKKHGENKTSAEIRSKYTLTHREAANKLEGNIKKTFDSLYTKFYRPASALAHGQAPLNFAVQEGQDMRISSTKTSGPQTRICINTACILMLYSLQNLNKLLGLNQAASISKIEQKFGDLMELVKKGHQSAD